MNQLWIGKLQSIGIANLQNVKTNDIVQDEIDRKT